MAEKVEESSGIFKFASAILPEKVVENWKGNLLILSIVTLILAVVVSFLVYKFLQKYVFKNTTTIYCAYDLEHTGGSPKEAKIISLGFLIFNEKFKELERKEYIINPTKDITKEATALHGFRHDKYGNLYLKDQEIVDTVIMYQVLSDLIGRLKKYSDRGHPICLIAHDGHKFGHKILEEELKRDFLNDKMPRVKLADSLAIAHEVYKQESEGNSILDHLKSLILGENDKQTHRALDDAKMIYRLLDKMRKKELMNLKTLIEKYDTNATWLSPN